MNTGSTYGTALLRGLYNFIAAALLAGITAYMGVGQVVERNLEASGVSERDRIVFALLTGVLAGLGALGFRGGVEGTYDGLRDSKGEVLPSDVGQPSEGQPAVTTPNIVV